jgi:hypothetical protein
MQEQAMTHDPFDLERTGTSENDWVVVHTFFAALDSVVKTDADLSRVYLHLKHALGRVVYLRNLDLRPEVARGEGVGSLAMQRLCALADEVGVALYVQPEAPDPSRQSRLWEWYVRHGFSPCMDDAHLLRRPFSAAVTYEPEDGSPPPRR